ncbi:MAG TPA: ASPIC/UnbV domain-containing protein, partial [Acidobacteriota bacterium]|nr:ASPIC/UnbV domain-containing protein [Acidobacteriota bacterium]
VVNRPTGKNRFGIGARVAVEGGALRQTREIRSGGSYLSQNDLRAHFGLGKRGDPVDISVEIPGEGKWEWRNTPVDQIVSLTINDDHAR